MCQADSVRFHGVTRRVCIIPNVGVVEVGNSLLGRVDIRQRSVEGNEARHCEQTGSSSSTGDHC